MPKALRALAGEPLLLRAVRRLRECPSVGPVVVVAPPGSVDDVTALLEGLGALVVAGGAERQDSVRAGLAALSPDAELVLVHDAARALVPVSVVEAVITALRGGAAAVVPVLPVADTIKQVDARGAVLATVPREDLRAVQTPQGFQRAVLEAAHRGAAASLTDDAGLVEASGVTVQTVPGAAEAFKVTTPFDLLVAEAVLARG
ncbi:MAG: 2-C-methyl-D-erythritol 4-phosphate cytidylyltransferase [Frankiales bacterium]|nr:2-C-methyl-D-erythritol 4-phosphate cytidylyltransferase [Frankiales bacterium]